MNKPTAFITGIAGFAGSWLAEELLAHGYRVTGGVYADEPLDNLAGCRGQLGLVPFDVADADQAARTIGRIRPEYIFHLAALASVSQSLQQERLTLRVNVEGTLNMLEAARRVRRLRKFVWAGSCDAYGVVRDKTLTEKDPLAPTSPYCISKAAGEHLCRSHFRRYGLPVTVARSFNHSGPRQAPIFVIADFARQAAAIDLGLQPPRVRVGNLAARRDFSDVRDIVRGYRLLAERGAPGEVYQLCSGRATSIETVLRLLLGFTAKPVAIAVDRGKWRAADIPVLRGSNRRAVEELGFANRYSLKQTLRETFAYWKERLSAENE